MRAARVTIQTVGPFRVHNALGQDLTPKSRKGQALIALLATSPNMRRSRIWLQAHLWSEVDADKAAKSLRQAILTTQQALEGSREVLVKERGALRLDPSLVDVDYKEIMRKAPSPHLFEGGRPEFLEGLDIGDPAFEDWLRQMRTDLDGYFDRFMDTDRTDLVAPVIAGGAVGPARQTEQLRFARRQAIAILPLHNGTGESLLDYAGAGISEDLIDRVGRLRWLPVIARGAANRFCKVGDNSAAISADLGARYLLDGDLDITSDGYSVDLRLHNGDTSRIMWSDRFLLPREDPRAELNRIIPQVVSLIDTKVDLAEQNLVAGREPKNGEFYDHIWQGKWHLNKITRDDAALAKSHFDHALKLVPDAPEGLIQAGWWKLWNIWATLGDTSELEEVVALSKRAMFGDDRDARAYCLLGLTETWRLNSDAAISLLKESIDLNPSAANALQHLGTAYYLNGAPEQSLSPLHRAVELSPGEPFLFLTLAELGMAYLMLGEHQKALDHANHALRFRPNYWYAQITRLHASLALGDERLIAHARADFARNGTRVIQAHFRWLPFKDKSWTKSLKETGDTAFV
ncbi:MAG: tetratricopeptide repeat protein [Pseudomonadota bacterium]